jgi:hypothetical protein
MNVTARPLQQSKTLSAAETAKRTIVQSGLSPSAMSRWADQNLIRLLNGKPSSVTERVTWVVEACQRVIQLDQAIKLASGLGPDWKALDAELNEIMEELYARVSKYRCVPRVRYIAEPDTCFDVSFEFLAASEGAKPECVAIAWLMDHIHAVHRIRRCRHAECRKWFFAVTDHQKYCGDRCRKRDAAHGETFKEKRRVYMRKYRSDEAERDARSKRLAKGKSK